MSNETRRCDWCREIANGKCGCAAEIEIERLRAAIVSMRPMLDKKRLAWKKHADYLDAVLGHNDQAQGVAWAEATKHLVPNNVEVRGAEQAPPAERPS